MLKHVVNVLLLRLLNVRIGLLDRADDQNLLLDSVGQFKIDFVQVYKLV